MPELSPKDPEIPDHIDSISVDEHPFEGACLPELLDGAMIIFRS